MNQEIRVSHSEIAAKEILDLYFGQFQKIDNFRPSWLNGLEIDRYYPNLGIAIEFQGDQHFRVVPGMHKDWEGFQRQVSLDTQKAQLLEKQGIKMFAINLLDLDRFRVINLFRTIANEAKNYVQKKGNQKDFDKLQKIRWDIEPDSSLMKKVDRLSRVKKSYYQPGKKPWWKKMLGL